MELVSATKREWWASGEKVEETMVKVKKGKEGKTAQKVRRGES